ncbi:PTS transporter subunit EIIA [Vibrio sp. SM6]|uniref:protein-N(pi)-phosphohistidine--D-fructose phosphotransferase n=1 Tax=Vibrio agarilyticus TaxID=2726741 RepID=A0A7X8YFU8_9VIBR|nr:fructose-specific PTS transporter subunit EIIC [Vibrio agarilyticus]NLS11662.1 PTS transporter subunit EIIA [Vibrio agarilyticus]
MNITDLISPELICTRLNATNKAEVFQELAALLYRANKLTDTPTFLNDVWAREEIANTGFEDGIAIPHAKSAAVKTPAIAVGISQTGIEYGAEDGNVSHLFFMLASPFGNDDHHIEVLAELSGKLIDDAFLTQLRQCQTSQHAYQLLTNNKDTTDSQHNSQATLPKPLSGWRQALSRTKAHLLFGTSHMIPFIVAGGVLVSISAMISGHADLPEAGILRDLAQMGTVGLMLFTTVLGGYIAYSIADKPGLAPGMIGAWIGVNQYNMGFIGAVLIGFIAGLTVYALKTIRLPRHLQSLGAIFLYPIMGTVITCGAVMWLIGGPIAWMMENLNGSLSQMAGASKAILGTMLGAMTSIDMGGPVNKVATLFAQSQVNTQPWLMGGVAIAICTPPLGMALATILAPQKFRHHERDAGKAAGIMGLIGISEGAIPFAMADPARVLPAIVLGGIIGNVTGFAFGVLNPAPWGGLIVFPVIDGKVGYLLGIGLGSMTTAAVAIALKKTVSEPAVTEPQLMQPITINEGEADILAVTACPSGVAHTFLAAKALEKAALKLGLRLKVETQGANGVENRITENDINAAQFVIFAHDVAIKHAERFQNINLIDVTTKDAMLNAESLLLQEHYAAIAPSAPLNSNSSY